MDVSGLLVDWVLRFCFCCCGFCYAFILLVFGVVCGAYFVVCGLLVCCVVG